MKRILLLIFFVVAFAGAAQATTIAYVVNNSTDTTTGLTFDKQWIRFFNDRMGYTVKVITDDSAALITTPGAYDGYFLSATINGANLSNLDTTSRGVVICDQLLYGDFRVATGQVNQANYATPWNLARVDSTHAVTKYMFGSLSFQYSGGTPTCPYVGIPSSASVWFTLSNKNWNGSTGDPNDTSFCYGIDAGGALVSGAAASGRRAVATVFYGLLFQQTDAGWCHPYELMGNICGWAWGDEENTFNADFNCYSTDMATDPGPEINQGWMEQGAAFTSVLSGGRICYDTRTGIMAFQSRYWGKKVMAGHEPDSFRYTFKVAYRGFGTDNPPHLYDTVTIVSVNSTTSMTIDTTTRNLSTVSTYDWFFQGSQSYGIVIRSGVGADTTQLGDTCRISAPSSGSNSSAVSYTRCGILVPGQTCSNIWNGTAGGQMRLLVADPYGGFNFVARMHNVLRSNTWTLPIASQGGNPEGSSTRTWMNRHNIVNGVSGVVAWDTTDMREGVDISATPIDSVVFNKGTFAPDGSSTVTFTLPGSYLNDPTFNWLVVKTWDFSGGGDSTDVEIGPSGVNTVRGAYVQKFEMFLSDASPQTLGVEDTTLVISVVYGVNPSSYYYNQIVNTGDGVVGVDSIVDNQSWLYVAPPSGATPFYVNHVIDTTGFGVATDTATVLVYASGADNTPLTYYVIYSQTAPPVETPAATIEKRTGLRLQ